MGNSASGAQRSATTSRRRRNPLLRRGLSANARQRLGILRDRLSPAGRRARGLQ